MLDLSPLEFMVNFPLVIIELFLLALTDQALLEQIFRALLSNGRATVAARNPDRLSFCTISEYQQEEVVSFSHMTCI